MTALSTCITYWCLQTFIQMSEEVLNWNGVLLVRVSFLEKYGLSRSSINNKLSKFRKGKSKYYDHISDPNDARIKWIKYNSIPASTRRDKEMPSEERLMSSLDTEDVSINMKRIRQVLYHAYNERFEGFKKHYMGVFHDLDEVEDYARTHAVFHACADLKRFKVLIKDIHEVYKEFQDLRFSGKSYKSFSYKLCDFEKRGAETFIHASLNSIRAASKLRSEHYEKIAELFCDSRLLSGRQITEMLNYWAIKNGFRQISISTVQRVIADPLFQNKHRPIRNGDEWVENHFQPFRFRNDAVFNGEVWQIDGSRLNIPYYDRTNRKPSFLHLFVVIDVHSRKIVGHSIADSENAEMVIQALKMAVNNTGYLPKQILKDNGACFKKKNLKELLIRIQSLRTEVRTHKPRLARDKGQIERLIGTIQTNVLKLYEGYVGEGIKSKRKEARPHRDKLLETFKPGNLRTRDELIKLVPTLIEEYNEFKSLKDNRSPRLRFELADNHSEIHNVSEMDFRLLFWERKIKLVKNSMIVLTEGSHRRKQYQYIFEDEYLKQCFNLDEVIVCYNRENRGEISIYNLKEDWVCNLKRSKPVNQIQPIKTHKKGEKEVQKVTETSLDETQTLRTQHRLFKRPATLDELLIKTKNND